MKIALTPKQMQEVDRYMIDRMKIPGVLLMENAAYGVYEAIREETDPCVVQVFCGTGNNGGDGFAVARILLAHGYDVHVIVLGNPSSIKEDAAINFAFFKEKEEYYTVITNKEALERLPEADVYVDAIFGTGLSRNVDGIYDSAVEYLNECEALIVSVDIPSGINAQNGTIMGNAVQADITVTFQYPKVGHFLYPGREHTGELQVARIGVDDGCDVPLQATVCAYESGDEDVCLGVRPSDSNKGSYGRLLLVAGSYGMAGAAVLSARAASRVGTGIVNAASSRAVINVLQQSVPEAICSELASDRGVVSKDALYAIEKLVEGKTAIAVGPGFGVGDAVTAIVGDIITKYTQPKVVDADALNALDGHLEFLENKQGDVILTPHPKEFSRLSGIPMEEILEEPLRVAAEFAVEYGVILVLKGSTTVVADPFGNTSLMCVGNPGMAKGGSGDVLTGVIAGLLAQGKDAFEAALSGVYIAGMAGEIAAEQEGEYSMTPMDTINCIGQVIHEMLTDDIEADTVQKKAEKTKELSKKVVKEHVEVPIETPVFRRENEIEEEETEKTKEEPEADTKSEEQFIVVQDMSEGETEIWKPEMEQTVQEELERVSQTEKEGPTMDFLEKYTDEPERMTRVQRRNTEQSTEKERKPFFKRGKVKQEQPDEQNIAEEETPEFPPDKGSEPTRRKIG